MMGVELWATLALIITIGGAALYIASEHGKKQKRYFECHAKMLHQTILSTLTYEPKDYMVYIREKYPFQDEFWAPSNLDVMKDLILASCTRSGPDGAEVYTEPQFSYFINDEAKKIYYVMGDSDFCFDHLTTG